MKYQINTVDGRILIEKEANSLKECVQCAVKEKADLRGAYLQGAYLQGAYLQGA